MDLQALGGRWPSAASGLPLLWAYVAGGSGSDVCKEGSSVLELARFGDMEPPVVGVISEDLLPPGWTAGALTSKDQVLVGLRSLVPPGLGRLRRGVATGQSRCTGDGYCPWLSSETCLRPQRDPLGFQL